MGERRARLQNHSVLAALGGAWVVSRVLYVAAYVSGAGQLRILAWFTGFALLVARFGAVFG